MSVTPWRELLSVSEARRLHSYVWETGTFSLAILTVVFVDANSIVGTCERNCCQGHIFSQRQPKTVGLRHFLRQPILRVRRVKIIQLG